MKVKQLLPILFNIEKVRICNPDEDTEWSGYTFSIPEKYYNYNIDKVCSFPIDYTNSCTYIVIKQKGVKKILARTIFGSS